MSQQDLGAFSMLSSASTSQCYKACVVHPDIELAPAEKNCLLRCTERFCEAVQVVMTAVETYVLPPSFPSPFVLLTFLA